MKGQAFAALLSAVVAVVPARAAVRPLPESSTVARAKAFAAKHGLATREVVAGPSWNRLTRLAMPLPGALWKDIASELGLRRNPDTGAFEGSLLFRQLEDDMTVMVPDGMKVGKRVLTPAHATAQEYWDQPAVIVHLSPAQANHVGRWLEARANDRFFRSGNGCSDIIMNIEVEPRPDGTHTLRSISAEEAASIDPTRRTDGQQPIPGSGVPMGKTVAEHTGVRASKQGFYMLMKWVWSGNENVQVLLVPEGPRAQKQTRLVASKLPNGEWRDRAVVSEVQVDQSFSAMTEAELLGPQHPHGVDAASRRPIAAEARAAAQDLDAQIRVAQAELRRLTSNEEVLLELAALEREIQNTHRAATYLRNLNAKSPQLLDLDAQLAALRARQHVLFEARDRPIAAPPEQVAEIRARTAALEQARDGLVAEAGRGRSEGEGPR